MRQHSEAAWSIASRYSHVLASETRDLAAAIDSLLAAEREQCAKIAETATGIGATWDSACGNIAAAIRDIANR